MITVVFSVGPWVGQQLELDRELSFGRAGCDITLDEPEVSRRHFVLTPAGTNVHVEDLGSSNGTFVNGHRITEAVSVGDADVIRVGTSELIVAGPRRTCRQVGHAGPVRRSPARRPRRPPSPARLPRRLRRAGLPGWLWVVTGLVEIALILTAATFLVYYAVG